MLSFAYGGATDLGKWTGQKTSSNGEPNWVLFKEAYLTLGVLLLLACIPSLLLSVGLMWLSVGALVEFSYEDKQLWIGAMLGAVGPAVAFLLSRPSMALRSAGGVATQNRIETISSIASIIFAALAVVLGGRLIAILLVQLFFTTLSRWVIIQFLAIEIKPYASKVNWNRKIFGWAREPLWKGLITMLSGMGVHRGVGVFLASTGTVGFAAPFLFVQSVLTTCQGIASAPLNSQLPRYSAMLEQGKRSEIGADSFMRIIFTTIIMVLAAVGVSFGIPILLSLIGSKMASLPIFAALLLGGLRCVYWPLICFNTVQGVSNDVKVVWRFLVAMPFSILLFYIGASTEQYFWFAIGMYVPYTIALNWFTWGNYKEFVGKNGFAIAKDAKVATRNRLRTFLVN